LKEYVLKIDGMMCPHCEAAVRKCLETFPEVEEAVPSHQTKQAVLRLNADLNLEAVKKAISELGYQVLD